jgi:predicted Zn-dependent protease
MDNESQLATVLGHEITHVENRHMLRHRRSAHNKEIGLLVAGVAAEIILAEAVGDAYEAGDWGKGAAIDAVGHLIVGLGLQVAFLASVQGYGRQLESEADQGGFARLEAAGYDVGQAEKVYLALAADRAGAPQAVAFFFSSHPRLVERIESARRYAAAHAPRPSSYDEQRFRDLMLPIVQSDAHANLDEGRLKTAAAGVAKALSWRANDPENHHLLGRLRLAEAAASDDPVARERLRVEAEDALRAAVRLDADLPGPHRELGLLLYEQGRLKNACTELRQFVELTRNDADDQAFETLRELRAGGHCR